jgi:prepilin-type processing-associated H-X9-DG protein/prepilin-type N-terminal cleavage/methylation domain-containing protein
MKMKTENSPARNSAFRSAFSLVEMLTVIVIIAVLAAISLVVTKRLKASATTVKCAGNLRQIGIGYQSFVADNGGSLPYTWDYGMSAVAEIGPNINVPGWWSMIKGQPEVCTVCPADDKNRRDGWPSYAFNIHLGDSRNGPRKKMAAFSSPERICVAGDGPSNGRGDLFLIDSQARNTDSKSAGFQWELRHSGGANVLFLDGHVEMMKPPFPYGTTNPFWHNTP